MKLFLSVFLFSIPSVAFGQSDVSRHFINCGVEGSITLFHLEEDSWIFSDSLDARRATLPASTFKILNSAIALETGAVYDEYEILEWDGTENKFFGTRIDAWNEDTYMKAAFSNSTIWFYVEMAKRIGREEYRRYLELSSYGNGDLSEPGYDFWNYGNFGISPVGQINFLKAFYLEELPFSTTTYRKVKHMMISEITENYIISGKTGWTKTDAEDIGWWVGYLEQKNNTWFFATRITRRLDNTNPDFSSCRTKITHSVLEEIGALH